MSEVVIPTTTNLGLKKPTYDNFADIKDAVDDNMDILDEAFGNIAKTIYPVGSIYMSVNNTSPSTLFPGTTWVQLTDRFLIGAGGSYAVNATGGAASQSYTPAGTVQNTTLTENQIPSHNHSFTGSAGTTGHQSQNHTHNYTKANGSTNATTLTIDQIPSHTHQFTNYWSTAQGSSGRHAADYGDTRDDVGGTTLATGGGQGHNHSISSSSVKTNENSANHYHSFTPSGTIGVKGGSQPHNHVFTGTAATIQTMPPYFAVYMWRRTA